MLSEPANLIFVPNYIALVAYSVALKQSNALLPDNNDLLLAYNAALLANFYL